MHVHCIDSIEEADTFCMIIGQAAVPAIAPMQTLPTGSQLLLMPDTTKTGAKDGAMTATVTGNLMCPVDLLSKLLDAYSKRGHPVTNYITRPLEHSGGHCAAYIIRTAIRDV